MEQNNNLMLDDGITTTVPPLPEQMPNTPETPADGGMFNFKPLATDIIGPDEFYAGFKSAFSFTGEWCNIKSMPIQSHEEVGARRTSDKLYEMAQKYPFLRFMIKTESTWLADVSLIGLFVYGKTNAILEEKAGFGLNRIIFGRFYKWFPKRKESGFLARLGLGKRQKQEQSSEIPNG